MTTETKSGNAFVEAVDISDERRVLLELKAREDDRFPKKYSFWINEDDDLEVVERIKELKKGELVWVAWEEKPMDSGRGHFRNITAVGNPSPDGAPASPPAESAIKRPSPPPVRGNDGIDERNLSIESQVALKEAWETCRDLMRVDRLSESDLQGRLIDFTLMGLRAMHEARGIASG